jgi:hypothetical protein
MFINCNFCDSIVPIKRAHNHMKIRHPEYKNNCPICKAKQLEMLFENHIHETHSTVFIDKESIIECTFCNKNYTWELYVKHSDKCGSSKALFTCIKCKKRLTRDKLKSHFDNITCPIHVKPFVPKKILEDDEYVELKTPKKDFHIIYTPQGGQQKKKR